jgi:phosphomannomutase
MLIRSVSGVRGLTDTALTPEVVKTYAQAVHRFQAPGTLIVGRDTRPSGAELATTLMHELTRLGRDVISCGIVPTPTVQFLVERTAAVGGIVITASHNPPEWNGLKFVRADGTFFHPDECQALFALADESTSAEPPERPGTVTQEYTAVQKHVAHIASLACLDIAAVRRRRFKVVVDAVNGAGAEALPRLLEALGCEVVPLNCNLTGEFVRGPEPLPGNLAELCEAVLAHKAAVGFALDPDGDRLALISEQGKPLGEEYTLVLAAEGYLRATGRKEPLVTNLSTTLALDRLAARFGCTVERSPVGEIHVVQKMLAVGANLGGEGNGGVILKEAHLGRDALVGAALVLNRLAQSERSLSQIFADLPQFEMVKDKVRLEGIDVDTLLEQVREQFAGAEINTKDGVKFIWEDRWIHLRKSNTEPILRIYAEAPTAGQAEKLVAKVKGFVKFPDPK